MRHYWTVSDAVWVYLDLEMWHTVAKWRDTLWVYLFNESTNEASDEINWTHCLDGIENSDTNYTLRWC